MVVQGEERENKYRFSDDGSVTISEFISASKRWHGLLYGIDYDHQGGWCLPCILFLTESEKENLGAFVCTPFTNYNKTEELCEKHASRVYRLHAMIVLIILVKFL